MKFVLALVSAIAVGLVIYLAADRWLAPEVDAAGAPSTAARTRVTALGRLEPESEVIDVSGSTGSRVHSLEVGEGDRVHAGDVIARLDGYLQSLAARDLAAIRLEEAQAMREAETEDGRALIEEATLQLEQVDTLAPLEIQAQEATIGRLEADLENAERNLERLQKLNSKDQVTDQEVDDQNVVVLRFREELARARLALVRLNAARDIDVLKLKAKLRSAQASLTRAQLATNAESLAVDLRLAKAELERSIVRAPVDGTILKTLTHPSERIGSDPIVKMGKTDQMYAVAEVYETDVRFVRPGQRASVRSPALPEPLTGTVERVSGIVFKNDVLDIDPAARVDARVVEVRIRLDDSTLAAGFSNLQVKVEIELAP